MKPQEIKPLRESRGLTQEQFAEKIEVGICTIRNWEQGRTGIGKRSQRDIQKFLESQLEKQDDSRKEVIKRLKEIEKIQGEK